MALMNTAWMALVQGLRRVSGLGWIKRRCRGLSQAGLVCGRQHALGFEPVQFGVAPYDLEVCAEWFPGFAAR